MAKKILLALAPLVLAGCASQPERVADSSPPPDMTQKLYEVAMSTEKLTAELVALEKMRMNSREPMKSPEKTLPPGHVLLKKITAVYRGDVRLVLRKLADQAGLQFMIVGKVPTLLNVTVDAKDQPLVRILESIGTQTGNVADISFDPGSNVLLIEYL